MLYVRDGLGGADRVLIDPRPAVGRRHDRARLVVPVARRRLGSPGASARRGARRARCASATSRRATDLPDRIPHTRHAIVAWLPDGESFYYSRYPAPGDVPAGDEKYFCRDLPPPLGEDWTRDPLVFGEGRDKTDMPAVLVSPDGRWLVVRVHMGWEKSEVWLRDLATPASPWVPVATRSGGALRADPARRRPLRHDQRRRAALPARSRSTTRAPARARWKEILPEGTDVLDRRRGGRRRERVIVASYLHEASARIQRFARDGRAARPDRAAGARVGSACRPPGTATRPSSS